MNHLQKNGIITYSAFKPFTIKVNGTNSSKKFNYGSVLIPVSKQNMSSEKLFDIISEMQNKFEVPVYNSESGYSLRGIDLGSNNFRINSELLLTHAKKNVECAPRLRRPTQHQRCTVQISQAIETI